METGLESILSQRVQDIIEALSRDSDFIDSQVPNWFSDNFLSKIPIDQTSAFLQSLKAQGSPWTVEESHVEGREGLFIVSTPVGRRHILASVEKQPPHRISGFAVRSPVECWKWEDVEPKLRARDHVIERLSPEIEELIHEFTAKEKVPGLAVRLSRDGELLHLQFSGSGNIDGLSALQPTSVFRVGSLAKVITTLAVLKLISDSVLGLDDPAENHLHSFRLTSHPDGPAITLRHLLSHASGLPRFQGNPMTSSSITEMLKGELRATRPAGQEYLYSNVGFVALGQIIEDVTGETFGDWTKSHVLDLLGMFSSGFAEDGTDNQMEGYERYGELLVVSERTRIIEHSAGAFCSSVDELSKISEALIHKALINEDLWRQATTPQSEEKKIGLGFHIAAAGDKELIWHNGGLPGWKAFWGCIPGEGLHVAITANTYPVPIENLGASLLELALSQN